MKVKEQVWNKLVRDRIPEIIEKNGGIVETRVLGKKEYLKELLAKLGEESQEVLEADEEHLLEELGDVETVVDGILEVKGWKRGDLRKQQVKKDKMRGKFMKRIYLINTKERSK